MGSNARSLHACILNGVCLAPAAPTASTAPSRCAVCSKRWPRVAVERVAVERLQRGSSEPRRAALSAKHTPEFEDNTHAQKKDVKYLTNTITGLSIKIMV